MKFYNLSRKTVAYGVNVGKEKQIISIGYNSEFFGGFKNLGILNASENAISQLLGTDYSESTHTVIKQGLGTVKGNMYDKLIKLSEKDKITEEEINKILDEYGYDMSELEAITGIDISIFITS